MRTTDQAGLSPGLRSRPSLSEFPDDGLQIETPLPVAGTTVPAFVERRGRRSTTCCRAIAVAGTTVPAFVERQKLGVTKGELLGLSPGLRSRPSLSSGTLEAESRGTHRCRRDYGPGLR